MITGELKSKIDTIWNAFWSGGIANPLEVIEQITYLLFIRRLDDLQTLAEKKANRTATVTGCIFSMCCWVCVVSAAARPWRCDGKTSI